MHSRGQWGISLVHRRRLPQTTVFLWQYNLSNLGFYVDPMWCNPRAWWKAKWWSFHCWVIHYLAIHLVRRACEWERQSRTPNPCASLGWVSLPHAIKGTFQFFLSLENPQKKSLNILLMCLAVPIGVSIYIMWYMEIDWSMCCIRRTLPVKDSNFLAQPFILLLMRSRQKSCSCEDLRL